MPLQIVYDVRESVLHKQSCFFGLQLQGQAEENVLLRNLRQCTDEDSEDVVGLAEPCDDVDVVEEEALDFLRDLEYRERETGRFWLGHCLIKEGGLVATDRNRSGGGR